MSKEPLGKEKQGKLRILDCGLNQNWILQKAEMDTGMCIQEVYFGKFHPKELDWETGKSNTRKVCYQAQQYHGQLELHLPRGTLRRYREYTSKLSTRRRRRNYPSPFFFPWSSYGGRRTLFMTLHFQDCTCFRIPEWCPEGIFRHGKGEAAEQKARDKCCH